MKTITQEELNKKLDLHALWLEDSTKGGKLMEITYSDLVNNVKENGVPSAYGNGDVIYRLDEPYGIVYNVVKEELSLYKEGIIVKVINKDIKDIMDISGLSRFNNVYNMIDYYDNLYQKEQEEKNKKQEAVKDFLSK
ncbi:hypothetical protein CF5_0012 [Staphylococcus phage CF5]|uniref:Uncharacterized protein n=1 Tax=Staphylococcus phage CF5 TaxID=3113739 RepID=A0AAX4J7F2_9CAUD|nr:hypothetical protein CF5_0012 [Staphylococcus phage CF5]